MNLEQSPVFGGNKVTVYPGGKSKFYSLFEDIDCAESHIHIFYYAIGDDHIGNELKEKIINKVKQGLQSDDCFTTDWDAIKRTENISSK